MYSQKVEEFGGHCGQREHGVFVFGRQDPSQVRERKGQGMKRAH